MWLRTNFSKFNTYIHLFIAFVIFLIPFFWYSSSNIISGSEIYTLLNPGILFFRNFSTWDTDFGFGLPNIHIIDITYSLFNIFLSNFFTLSYIQKIFFGLSFSLSFLSFYYFVSYLFKNDQRYTYIYIISSIIYVFNPYSLSMFPWFSTYSFLFFVLPYLIKEISLFIREKRSCIYLLLLFFLLASVASNIALFGVGLLIIALFSLYEFYNVGFNYKKMFVLVSIFIISNLFWILPLSRMYSSLFGGGRVYSSVLSDTTLFKQPILKAFTLNEYYFLDKKDSNDNLYYEYSYYYKDLSIIIFLVLILVFFIALFLSHEDLLSLLDNKNYIIFFIVIFVIGVFLTKGTSPPFGDLYSFLLKNFRIFQIYRASDLKFSYLVMFSFPILLAWGFITIKSLLTSSYYKLVFNTILVVPLLLSLPYLQGNIFRSPFIVNVPYYWYEFSDYINKNKDNFGRILLYPNTKSSFDSYTWGYYGGWFTYSILNNPTIGYTKGYGTSIQEKYFSKIEEIYNISNINLTEYERRSLLESFKKFNITHLLYRDDLTPKYTNTYDKYFLDENFTLLNKFGNLYIYATSLNSRKIYSEEPFVTVYYDQIYPHKYKIELVIPRNNINSNSFINLNFLESFDANWNIKLTDGSYVDEHSLYYDYGNTWKLNIQDICKKDDTCSKQDDLYYKIPLLLEFYPQKLYEYGLYFYIYFTSFVFIATVYKKFFRGSYV